MTPTRDQQVAYESLAESRYMADLERWTVEQDVEQVEQEAERE
jgi:hypothetical protein